MEIKNIETHSPEAQPARPAAVDGSAAGVKNVLDKSGRRIWFKKLRPSERYALADAVDAKTASTEIQAIVAASCISIDDDGIVPVKSKALLLRALDELGDEGLAAVTRPVLELYGYALDEKEVEIAKN